MSWLLAPVIVVFIAIPSASVAQESEPVSDPGPKFGPEFTFPILTGKKFDKNTKEILVDHLRFHLVRNQVDGEKFDVQMVDEYGDSNGADPDVRFFSPHQWDFDVTTDPGVIEVLMRPMFVSDFVKYASDMQDAIFVTASNMGLRPAPFLGGGHINIDFKYLERRPRLLRNFLADLLINHVELFMGIFGYDTNNALPSIMMSSQVLTELKDMFEHFDNNTNPTEQDSQFLVLKTLQIFERFKHVDPYTVYWQKQLTDFKKAQPRNQKYLAVNFALDADAPSENRMELRAVRPQQSMDMWIRQIRLLRNRLRYLEKLSAPVPIRLKYNLVGATDIQDVTKTQALNPPIAGLQALENFKVFAEESGEKIEDHLDYIWPAWATDGSLEEFKSKYGIGKSCVTMLQAEAG